MKVHVPHRKRDETFYLGGLQGHNAYHCTKKQQLDFNTYTMSLI